MQAKLVFDCTVARCCAGRDEVALEVLEFIKSHQGLLDRILRDDTPGVHLADLDELQLASAILSKVMTLSPWHV